MSKISLKESVHEVQNRVHKALVSANKITLINKTTGDEIDFVDIDNVGQRECLLDVIFNRNS